MIFKESRKKRRELSKKKQFVSTHKLDFLCAEWRPGLGYTAFKVGTCHGAWRSTPFTYDILAIVNDCPGNGHLIDVFEWFENSCKRDHKELMILEVWNKGFKEHLIEKKGFIEVEGTRHLTKKFN